MAAALLAAAWLGLAGWWALTARTPPAWPDRGDPVEVALAAIAVAVPLAVFWLLAAAARTARMLRAESRAIRAELDALRRAGDAAPAGFGVERDASVRAAIGAKRSATSDVASRPDDAGGGAAPPSPADFVRALDFPDGLSDAEGFAVLRAAMAHPGTAALVTAARDVLAALAQDGIYMDDLTAGSADPVLWRAFAAGARGPEVAALARVRDRSSLALTRARMRDAPTFRAAVEQLIERFEQSFARFAADASDAEIAAFAETRTARAFMVCARVAGTVAPGEAQPASITQRISP